MRRNTTHLALKLLTAPVNAAVDLADLKTFLRIDGTDDDDMLQAFIDAAEEQVEAYTKRALISQTWDLWLDAFPGRYDFDSLQDGVQEGKLSEYFASQNYLELPKAPIQSVTYLKTYDDSNTEYTMSSSDYFVDTFSEPGRLSLTNNSTWPPTFLRPTAGIQVRFVAGYGANASDIPKPLQEAVKRLAAFYYQQRGCTDAEFPKDVLALIMPYRILRFG